MLFSQGSGKSNLICFFIVYFQVSLVSFHYFNAIHYVFSSPNGKLLVFLSARTSVDSGAHMATNSLHRIQWPEDGRLSSSVKIVDVVSSQVCLWPISLLVKTRRLFIAFVYFCLCM